MEGGGVNHSKFQALIRDLYGIVSQLEDMFPGRHFTPDGHMVGSIGECLVADAYGLTLETASNKGFDAKTSAGRKVEIKATQGKSVGFRHEPEHAIVIKINKQGTFEEVYNGPGPLVWKQFAGKPLPSNGQYSIGLAKLKALMEHVSEGQRLPRVSS